MVKKKKWITVNTIKSSKGTSYVRTSTKNYKFGAGHRKVVFVKKKRL